MSYRRALTPLVAKGGAAPLLTVTHSSLPSASSAAASNSAGSASMPCVRFLHSSHLSAVRRSSASIVHNSSAKPVKPVSSLTCSRATVKSRSLSPDDPFGEKSSWEDPSDGLYSAWKDVDQEGFVNATQSAEVRSAHFGPEWARFTTVGRLSVKKMKEEQALKPHPPPDGAAADGTSKAAASASAVTPKQYPTAEELHEAELKAKRRMLERNYTSYEAFLEHELGAGEGFSDETAAASSAAGGATAGAELYSAASMEEAFAVVDGVDGRDRMAQRNAEREALDSMEAAEVEETVPLPNFMLDEDARHFAATAAAESTHPAAAPSQGSEESNNGLRDAVGVQAATAASAQETSTTPTEIKRATTPSSASTSSTGIPTAVVRQVLQALGSPHGDPKIPLTDPMHWDTEEIIHYLSIMEQRPADVDAAAARDSWTTMEATMCDTFRMAPVTGDMLLNVVVPPRLFRLMRRWHVRRQDVVNRAWKQYQEQIPGTTSVSDNVELPAEMVAAAVAQHREKLDEAVQPLDHILIQETILLCFPYGH